MLSWDPEAAQKKLKFIRWKYLRRCGGSEWKSISDSVKTDVMILKILKGILGLFCLEICYHRSRFVVVFFGCCGIWIKVNLAHWAFYFIPSIFQSLRQERELAWIRKSFTSWSPLVENINCQPMKSMKWLERMSELLCLNKIKLNHFVIISMMKRSEIYRTTFVGEKVSKQQLECEMEGKSEKWVRNKVEFISTRLPSSNHFSFLSARSLDYYDTTMWCL